MTNRRVVEDDFRMLEYRGKDPEDYEFRTDGILVRKDRWEVAVKRIADIVDMDISSFEIDDVITAVENLKSPYDNDQNSMIG